MIPASMIVVLSVKFPLTGGTGVAASVSFASFEFSEETTGLDCRVFLPPYLCARYSIVNVKKSPAKSMPPAVAS